MGFDINQKHQQFLIDFPSEALPKFNLVWKKVKFLELFCFSFKAHPLKSTTVSRVKCY